MHEHEKIVRVGVAAIIVNDKHEVLVGYRNGKHAPNCWGFPGGHLEYGEMPHEAAIRETEEETGLIVRPTTKPFLHRAYGSAVFPESGKHYITLYVPCEVVSGEVERREKDKCAEWRWVPMFTLPKPMMETIPDDLFNTQYTACEIYEPDRPSWDEFMARFDKLDSKQIAQISDEESDMSARQLFDRYVVNGPSEWHALGGFVMEVKGYDAETMVVQGVVKVANNRPCFFKQGEEVYATPLHREVWRLLSEEEDHGQAVFLGQDYGGIGIGS